MDKIKKRSVKTEIFTTTDEREFNYLKNAKDHQNFLDKERVVEQLEKYIHKIYDIPTQEEIDRMDNAEKYDEAEALEEKRNDYFYDKCVGIFDEYNIVEIAEIFIEMWQSFGEENIGKFFLFIKERL